MLGPTEKTFPRNEEEWQRQLFFFGVMIFAGLGAAAMGVYNSLASGNVFWVLIGSGLGLALLGGYLLIQLRPRLLSIEICKEGLRINERDGTSDVLWDEIRFIEESTIEQPHGTVNQVFIERRDDLGFVANGLTIAHFDDFIEALREIASRRSIEIRHP